MHSLKENTLEHGIPKVVRNICIKPRASFTLNSEILEAFLLE